MVTASLLEPGTIPDKRDGTANLRFAEKQNRNKKSPGKKHFKAAATVVAAVILTCALAEGLARILTCMTAPPDGKDRGYDAKMRIAASMANAKESTVIFLGNSIGNQCIYSDLIEERLRQKGYKVNALNLATTASSIKEELHLLKMTKGPQAGPRFVVYQVSPSEFEKEMASASDAETKFLASYVGKSSTGTGNFWQKGITWLDQYSYLSRYRSYWRWQLLTSINLIADTEAHTHRGPAPQVDSQCSPTGWSPWYGFGRNGEMDINTLKGWRTFYFRTGKIASGRWIWDFSKIEEIKDFCKKNQLPLMFVWLPELSDKTSLWRWKHSSPEECISKATVLLESSGIQLLDLHDADSDSTHFVNWNHHNALGAVHISEILAQKLSQSAFAKQFKQVEPPQQVERRQ